MTRGRATFSHAMPRTDLTPSRQDRQDVGGPRGRQSTPIIRHMRLASKQPLLLQPITLCSLIRGGVVTLSSEPLRHRYLTAYRPDLTTAWNVEVRPDAIGLTLGDLDILVLDRSGVSVYESLGRCMHRVDSTSLRECRRARSRFTTLTCSWRSSTKTGQLHGQGC